VNGGGRSIRRVGGGGALLALIVASALWLWPAVGSGAIVSVSVLDNMFDPKTASFEVLLSDDPNVRFDWDGIGDDTTKNKHNVKSNARLFKSGKPTDTRSPYEVQFSAGKFPYHCKVHRDSDNMKGKVKIAPLATDHILIKDKAGTGKGAGEESAKVHWATETTTTGTKFDVQFRVDGKKWKGWKNNTRKFRARFGKNAKPRSVDFDAHTYEVRARSEKGKPSKRKRSRWSPPETVNPFM